MKSFRTRKWLRIHKERRIILTHEDAMRITAKSMKKIILLSTKSSKCITVINQDIHLLSGAGKPGQVWKNIWKDLDTKDENKTEGIADAE
ncbi:MULTISPECIES: hypothetical protein [unclassified Psychrobacillus]|uniref:hypothetical protein n=1 Tax=unclassified Psychrobacillus TaxID=2636677 RepID=UPI0030F4BA15